MQCQTTQKEDRQRFKSAKENYKSAKEESKKVIGRAIRVARSESGTHVERFKKKLKTPNAICW